MSLLVRELSFAEEEYKGRILITKVNSNQYYAAMMVLIGNEYVHMIIVIEYYSEDRVALLFKTVEDYTMYTLKYGNLLDNT